MTTAPWLDLEPVLCPWCDGPCIEPVEDQPEEDEQ